MSDPIRQLHDEVARVRGRGNGRGHKYPVALRSAVIAHVRRRRAHGDRISAISRELGLRPDTLHRWLEPGRAAGFRPVEVVPTGRATPAGGGPVVTLPNGMCIEGLDLPDLLALVRALA